MCDVCKILSEGPTQENTTNENLTCRSIVVKDKQELTVQLCSEHDRVFFLKGTGGFLRIYPQIMNSLKSKKSKSLGFGR